MNCKKPFRQGLISFGCGQCLACRINRRRIWTARIILEWLTTGLGCFITLTYADEFLPDKGNLEKRELQLFIKRLRKKFSNIRYYAVGEYGDTTWRPHYHIIIFGHFISANQLKGVWGKGRVQIGELNEHTAQYVAGYINKKLTKDSDKLLRGKKPEFALMSRRPGIGYNAVKIIDQGLEKMCFQNEFETNGDVPNEINFGRKKMPLGRYLKSKLRTLRGLDDEKNKEKRLFNMSLRAGEEFKMLKEEARILGRNPEAVAMEKRIQKLNQMEKKQKIFSKRGKL